MPFALFRLILFLIILAVPCAAVAADYGSVSTGQLKAKLNAQEDMVLVDARTAEEYEQSHIPGAININEKNFECEALKLPVKKNTAFVIYCNGVKCGKSAKVAKKIEALGYKNLSIYREGIPVWEERNLPLVKGPDYGKKIETSMLKPAELKKIVDAKDASYVIVDVREPKEFAEGHIPGAINIPMEQFASQSEKLPKEKKIIVYCNSGSRSYIAYRKLIQLAYPHRFQAVFADWKEAGYIIEK